jgi:hypothetical protein
MFANICAGSLTKNEENTKNKDHLILLLEELEQLKANAKKAKGKELEEISSRINNVKLELQKLIIESRKMSFLPWLGFKNIKCAQWQAIFSFMTTIPIWAKLVKEAFKTIKALKKSCNLESQKSTNDGVKNETSN